MTNSSCMYDVPKQNLLKSLKCPYLNIQNKNIMIRMIHIKIQKKSFVPCLVSKTVRHVSIS